MYFSIPEIEVAGFEPALVFLVCREQGSLPIQTPDSTFVIYEGYSAPFTNEGQESSYKT